MNTRDIIIGSSIIAIGIALHGYLSRQSTGASPVSVTCSERRYTAIANHATDLAARIMVLDRDTGDCKIFNCKGESTEWVEKDRVIKLWDDK